MKKLLCAASIGMLAMEMACAMDGVPPAPPLQIVAPVAPVIPHHTAPARLINDLMPGDVNEQALLNALAAKNIDIIGQRQYSPPNIVSLKEYLQFLINDGFNAAAVNGYQTEKAARFALLARLPKAEAYFYDEEMGKKTVFRTATLASSQLFDLLALVIANAGAVLSGGNAQSISQFARRFGQELNVLSKRCGNLGLISQRYFANRAGRSRDALEESEQRIGAVINALRTFILDIVRRAGTNDDIAMRLFHEMYSDMDQLRLCDRFFEPSNYDDIDPATVLNDNMHLRERYQAWRNRNGHGPIPDPNRPI
ncbi:MAG: hypothetical protein LBB34_01585 [Holosporales bacterium]|jgi:hypothetical protein|nr:hypothetical protein [Holosporales bacterium]